MDHFPPNYIPSRDQVGPDMFRKTIILQTVEPFGEGFGSGPGQFALGFVTAPATIVDPNTGATALIAYTDPGNNRIQFFNPEKTYITGFTWDGFKLNDDTLAAPSCAFLDHGDGTWHLYVVDPGNSRVVKFDSSFNYVSEFGAAGSADGDFNFAVSGAVTGICLDPSGNIYVTDPGNNRVQSFDSTGTFRFKMTTDGTTALVHPQGVAVNSAGAVFVVDTGNNRVVKFATSDGSYVSKFGSAGNGNGQFESPTGVATDMNNATSLYVADTGNSRVQVFDQSGTYLSQEGVWAWTNPYALAIFTSVGNDTAVFDHLVMGENVENDSEVYDATGAGLINLFPDGASPVFNLGDNPMQSLSMSYAQISEGEPVADTTTTSSIAINVSVDGVSFTTLTTLTKDKPFDYGGDNLGPWKYIQLKWTGLELLPAADAILLTVLGYPGGFVKG